MVNEGAIREVLTFNPASFCTWFTEATMGTIASGALRRCSPLLPPPGDDDGHVYNMWSREGARAPHKPVKRSAFRVLRVKGGDGECKNVLSIPGGDRLARLHAILNGFQTF